MPWYCSIGSWADRSPLHEAASQGRLLSLKTLITQVKCENVTKINVISVKCKSIFTALLNMKMVLLHCSLITSFGFCGFFTCLYRSKNLTIAYMTVMMTNRSELDTFLPSANFNEVINIQA